MRRFKLQRDVDLTGISGVGVVAEGIEFSDGSCVMRWCSATPSTVAFASAGALEEVHGHGGHTRLIWIDQPPRAVGERAQLLGRRDQIIARLRKATPR